MYTKELGRGYYYEKYKVDSYGVGGDVYSAFLTDSLDENHFITYIYDDEVLYFNFIEDSILVKKYQEKILARKFPDDLKWIKTYSYFIKKD